MTVWQNPNLQQPPFPRKESVAFQPTELRTRVAFQEVTLGRFKGLVGLESNLHEVLEAKVAAAVDFVGESRHNMHRLDGNIARNATETVEAGREGKS